MSKFIQHGAIAGLIAGFALVTTIGTGNGTMAARVTNPAKGSVAPGPGAYVVFALPAGK